MASLREWITDTSLSNRALGAIDADVNGRQALPIQPDAFGVQPVCA